MSKGLLMVLMTGIVIAGLVFAAGCESDTGTGALLGTAAGAGVGAIVGHQTGHTAGGALIGGAVGGGTGLLLGSEGDRKKEQKAEVDSLRSEQNTVTVWITNSNGSQVPVRLTRSGPNFIGPRGEIYSSMPTEEQLKKLYGM